MKQLLQVTPLKLKLCIVNVFLTFLIIGNIQAQSIVGVPPPFTHNGAGRGMNVLFSMTYNGDLYLSYQSNNAINDLVKYDGTSLTVIPTPAGFNTNFNDGFDGVGIEYDGNLYLRYHDGSTQSAMFKYDGTNLTQVPYPAGYDTIDNVFNGTPFVYNGLLYVNFKNNSGSNDLLAYDGTSFTTIPTPTGYENYGYTGNYLNQPITYNNKMYISYIDDSANYDLVEFDGTNLNVIPSPAGFDSTNAGYHSEPFIFNNKLYLKYQGNGENYNLFEYDGTTLMEIPNPVGFDTIADNKGYYGDHVVYNNKLYLGYRRNGAYRSLFEYDGTNLTKVPIPANIKDYYVSSPIVYNCDLYMVYDGNTQFDLVKFDGDTLTVVPTPMQLSFSGYPFVYKGNLFVRVAGAFASGSWFEMAMYNGDSIVTIPSPLGYTGARSGYLGQPYIYNDLLHFMYRKSDQHRDLAYLDTTGLIQLVEPNCSVPLVLNDLETTYDTCGLGTGSISLDISGGVQPYEYSIDMGGTWQTDSFFSGLLEDNYTILVKDAQAQTDTFTAVVNILNTAIRSFYTDTICNGDVYMGYSATGVYIDTIATANCDSIRTVDLTVLDGTMIDIVQQGTELIVPSGYDGYQWYQDGVATETDTNTLTITVNGDYTVELTDSNSCTYLSNVFSADIVGVQLIEMATAVYIYPNPTRGSITVKFDQQITGDVLVTNALGKLVKQVAFTQADQINMDLTIEAGVYFVTIQTLQGNLVRKLVVAQ